MPKGVKKAKKQLDPIVTPPAKPEADVAPIQEAVKDEPKKEAKKETKILTQEKSAPEAMAELEARSRSSRNEVQKGALDPLGPGQRYFESPEGDIVIGEASAPRLWHHKSQKWILPKR